MFGRTQTRFSRIFATLPLSSRSDIAHTLVSVPSLLYKGRVVDHVMNHGPDDPIDERPNLSDVDLSHADFSYTNFSRAILSHASLSDADLRGTDLSHANFLGADFIDLNVLMQTSQLVGVMPVTNRY